MSSQDFGGDDASAHRRRENPKKSAIFWLPSGRQDFVPSALLFFASDACGIASSEEDLHLEQNLGAQLTSSSNPAP